MVPLQVSTQCWCPVAGLRGLCKMLEGEVQEVSPFLDSEVNAKGFF